MERDKERVLSKFEAVLVHGPFDFDVSLSHTEVETFGRDCILNYCFENGYSIVNITDYESKVVVRGSRRGN